MDNENLWSVGRQVWWGKNPKTEESRIKAVRTMRRGHDDEPRNEILGRPPQ